MDAGTGNRAARIVFVVLVAAFALLSLAVAFLNPPWEAVDESSHVQNVETLVGGHWYRIERGAGLEPHQPPLYYLLLAGLQRLSGLPARVPHPVLARHDFLCVDHGGHPVAALGGRPLRCTIYRHDLPRDSSDERLVRLLRLPSVVFGIGVLLLTGAVARQVSKDPWTPFVAAAFVAGVPGFVFTSATVNNEGLVNVLAAVTLLVAVAFVRRSPTTTKDGRRYAAILGALLGLLLLTKLYGPIVVIGIGASIWLATSKAPRRVARRVDLLLIVGGAAVVLTAWWLLQNQRWYGDPLAITASRDYLTLIFGLGFPRHYGVPRIVLVDVRHILASTFYYNSVAGRLLWVPLIGSILCLALPSPRMGTRNRAQLFVLTMFAVSAGVALCVVAVQTSTFRASTAYLGLPALACLAALGLERLPVHTAVRILVPIVGCVVTLAIYQHDLIALYRR